MTQNDKPTADGLVAAAKAAVSALSLTQAEAALATPGTVFVDVRDSKELEAGMIAGAHHTPRGGLEFALDTASDFADPKLTGAARLVMVCGSGGRAALAAHLAQQMGHCVLWLEGGMKGWIADGRPVVSPES